MCHAILGRFFEISNISLPVCYIKKTVSNVKDIINYTFVLFACPNVVPSDCYSHFSYAFMFQAIGGVLNPFRTCLLYHIHFWRASTSVGNLIRIQAYHGIKKQYFVSIACRRCC